jgi:formyl-CoA transferase
MSAPYQAVRCSDGYITLAAANDRLFVRLAALMNHPEWPADPDFENDTARVRNRGRLADAIEAVTISQPRQHWLDLLDANGIPCGPINNYQQVFADPHIAARGMAVEIAHPTLGRIKTLGSPIKMSATPPVVDRRAPRLGEHTSEVLREAGFSDDEITQLNPKVAPREKR